jgi:hypothetical protein
MDAYPLFLRRCAQVATLLESHDEGDLLDLSKHLRQLLCDRHSLVETVNRGRGRIPLEFHTGAFSVRPDKIHPTVLSLEDGIDPQTRRPGAPSVVLTHKQFLRHVVLWTPQQSLTVKDVILHAAVVAGGVHHDPYDKGLLVRLSTITIGGLPIGIRMLKAIARVTLRGLDPLIKKIEAAG